MMLTDDKAMTEKIKKDAQQIIEKYDLPLEVVELEEGKPVRITGGFFNVTIGFLLTTMIIRPKHYRNVAVVVGRNKIKWWMVGQYWDYLVGCPDYYCFQYNKRDFDLFLLKTTIDSYLRFVPDQFYSYTEGFSAHVLDRDDIRALTAVVLPVRKAEEYPSPIEYDHKHPLCRIEIAVRDKHSYLVSPEKWRTQISQLLDTLYSIPVEMNYLSLSDAVSFVRSAMEKYKFPLREIKEEAIYCIHPHTAVSELSYAYDGGALVLGNIKGYKEEFPAIWVINEIRGKKDIHLTTLGHLCGGLFLAGLNAYCGGTLILSYSLPTPDTCILIVKGYGVDDDIVYFRAPRKKKITVLNKGKLVDAEEWWEFARALKAELIYERINGGSKE